MKYLSVFISVLSLLMFSFSCSHKEAGENKSDTVQDSIIATNQDTLPEPNEEVAKTPLNTTASQLNYMKNSTSWNKYESGILPDMASDAPSYCQKILESDGKRFIIVDKGKMKVFLYDPYGNIEKSYGIACAKNYGTKHKFGDSRTTEGIFEVEGVYDSTNWLYTNDAGYTSPTKGVYGPRFIRLTTPYIGIHGTGSPGSIGKRCSHGCIRVVNDNILELVKYVEPGMPVIISPGPVDMAVNEKEGSVMLSVVTEPGTPKAVAGSLPAQSRYMSPSASNDSTASNVQTQIDVIEVEGNSDNETQAPESQPQSDATNKESVPESTPQSE